MPDILQTIRDTYAENPAAALNLLPTLFKQYDEGLIKVLPCKVGDKVTAKVLRPYNGHELSIQGEVTDIELVFRVQYDSYRHVDFLASDYGKTVFPREAAEKALERKL